MPRPVRRRARLALVAVGGLLGCPADKPAPALPEDASLCVLDSRSEVVLTYDARLTDGAAPVRSMSTPITRVRPMDVAYDPVNDQVALADDHGPTSRVIVTSAGSVVRQLGGPDTQDRGGGVEPGVRWVGFDPTRGTVLQSSLYFDRTHDSVYLSEYDLAQGKWQGSLDVGTHVRVESNIPPFVVDPARDRVLIAGQYSSIYAAPRDLSGWGEAYIFGGIPFALELYRAPGDPSADELAVLRPGSPCTVSSYALARPAGEAPVRTLEVADDSTALCERALAVDPVHDELFLAEGHCIQAYPRLATGAAAPSRRLCSAARLSGITGLAVDTRRDELLVAVPSSDGLLVFARDAAGDDVTPRRVDRTAPSWLASTSDLAFQPVGETLVALNTMYDAPVVMPAHGQGQVVPQVPFGQRAALRGMTQLAYLYDGTAVLYRDHYDSRYAPPEPGPLTVLRPGEALEMALESSVQAFTVVGNELFVVRAPAETGGQAVLVGYDPRVAPKDLRVELSLMLPAGVAVLDLAVDRVHGEAYVLTSGQVSVFPLTGSGETTPVRTLTVPADARQLALSLRADRLAAMTGDALYSWARTAQGDTAPLGVTRTGLGAPVAITRCR